MQVGFHASHEQFTPRRLLDLVVRAEEAGFDAAMCSDHLTPWSEEGTESGFAWTWLGAAAARTQLPLGVVTAPGDRYHPAITAQAIATVADLAAGGFAPALGSGQAMNEHVTGRPWPPKAERNARLAECADVIRRLLAGETVDHDGLVTVRQAKLYTLPEVPPPLFAAALSPESARDVAAWADGLITVLAPEPKLRALMAAFADGGGAGKPVYVQMHLSWADTEEEARSRAMESWRCNSLPPILAENLDLPVQFDAAAAHVPLEQVSGTVLVSADLGRYVDELGRLAELGVERVMLHQVGPAQEEFVDTFGEQVLPRVGGRAGL